MKTSQIGVSLIKHFEGFKAKPYLCPAKIPTIGYGATFYKDGKKVTLQDKPITEEGAEELLKLILKSFESIVMRKIKIPLKQCQFDALVSHTYNTGGSDTLFKLINQNAPDEQIRKWFTTKYITGGGKRLQGLVNRRNAEAKLYFHEI
ncbi:MAG: lysozyme [Ignavibacteria bacterium]